MRNPKAPKTKTLPLRVDDATAERVRILSEWTSAKNPWLLHPKAAILRSALLKGLDVLETERRADEPKVPEPSKPTTRRRARR